MAFVLGEPSFAQKLVDPNSVAPEFREAAVKRRAEQIRQIECGRKADAAKVLPRDRTAYLTVCLAEEGPNPATAAAKPGSPVSD
ncbi:hypothetical protein [Bradyrhizobium sp.]|uniref:hypothetical protein n=1 Tax=Bradyrhizobium sp. TaxID=376 RepID=UPI0025C703DA|nr:hypothetical protein [Bradyrhizobium sp.]